MAEQAVFWQYRRMAYIAQTTASLRFFGDDLDPEKLTEILGRPPSGSHRKGEVIRSASGGEYVKRTGSWRFKVDDRTPGDLDAHIAEIFSQLTSDLSSWKELAKYKPDLFMGFFMNKSNEMADLSATSLMTLGERGVTLTFDVYDPTPELNNIQIIDGADNATFSIFQATHAEYRELFPGGQDMEIAEDFVERVGEARAKEIFDALWERPVLKRYAEGIAGTLFFGPKRWTLPPSKREVDVDDRAINPAQRKLFAEWR